MVSFILMSFASSPLTYEVPCRAFLGSASRFTPRVHTLGGPALYNAKLELSERVIGRVVAGRLCKDDLRSIVADNKSRS